jgi:DNA repair exonuclease SbcCD ATPase subunit
MFGFGIGEVAAILTALKGLNEMLATVKETGSNASSFAGLISKYSDLDEKIRDVDQKAAKKPLTLEQSMKLQVAKRQAESFHQALKDSLLMQQGGAKQYKEIMERIEESKRNHAKMIASIKKKRQARVKLLKEIGLWAFIGLFCSAICIGIVWTYIKFR